MVAEGMEPDIAWSSSRRMAGGLLGTLTIKSVTSSKPRRGTSMTVSQKAPVSTFLPTGPSTLSGIK
eukprot:3867133-Amphidinium_carterae.1